MSSCIAVQWNNGRISDIGGNVTGDNLHLNYNICLPPLNGTCVCVCVDTFLFVWHFCLSLDSRARQEINFTLLLGYRDTLTQLILIGC